MKRFVLFSFLNRCLIVSLLAQNPDKKQNLPQENLKVTKEYDENGNLTRFDSVYTYNWSGDTTIMKSFSPADLSKMFDGGFSFFSDSTFKGNSFFNDFDRMFVEPYIGGRDSLFLKPFDQFHNFGNFNFNDDSIAPNSYNFDDFLGQMTPNKNDSIPSKSPRNSLRLQPKSMEEMMQMLQFQMQEMEEYHRKFFKKQPKTK